MQQIHVCACGSGKDPNVVDAAWAIPQDVESPCENAQRHVWTHMQFITECWSFTSSNIGKEWLRDFLQHTYVPCAPLFTCRDGSGCATASATLPPQLHANALLCPKVPNATASRCFLPVCTWRDSHPQRLLVDILTFNSGFVVCPDRITWTRKHQSFDWRCDCDRGSLLKLSLLVFSQACWRKGGGFWILTPKNALCSCEFKCPATCSWYTVPILITRRHNIRQRSKLLSSSEVHIRQSYIFAKTCIYVYFPRTFWFHPKLIFWMDKENGCDACSSFPKLRTFLWQRWERFNVYYNPQLISSGSIIN